MLSIPRPSLPSDPGQAVMLKVGSRMWDWKIGQLLSSADFRDTSSVLVAVNTVHFSVLFSGWRASSQNGTSVSTIVRRQGVLTIYKNHPVGNFRHKHKTIECEVAGVGITIKYIHIS